MFATVTSRWQFGPFLGKEREILPGEVFYQDFRHDSTNSPRRDRTLVATLMGVRLEVTRIDDPTLGFYAHTTHKAIDIPGRRVNFRVETLIPGLVEVISAR